MIYKLNDKKFGYMLDETSTPEEFKKLMDEAKVTIGVKCLVMNSILAKSFSTPFLGQSIITINNKIPDNVFFINHVF